MRPKSVFFFKKGKFLRYRARTDTVDINTDIGPKWPGFTDAGFDTGIDAVLNAGNGFIYFFKGENCLRYNPRLNRVDISMTPISVG